MINILGKVNKYNYKELTNSDFPGYEVFLGSEDDFKYLPEIARRLNIVSAHQPAKNFDLAARGDKGENSFRLMVRLLKVLNGLGFKGVVVIHGAFYNEITNEKNACLKILAKRLDRLSALFPDIKISLESDILFFNQILENRALLAMPEDFLELKKYLTSRLYITLDFEHVLISALFQDFIGRNNRFYVRLKNLADLKKPPGLAAKTAWLGYLKKNRAGYDKIFSAALKKYEKLKGAIVHFHLSPSDMLKYWYDRKTFVPLQGEHLTAGQAGDKLNYDLIFKRLPKLTAAYPVNLVLEIWPRRVEKYVAELKRSGKIIKKYVK